MNKADKVAFLHGTYILMKIGKEERERQRTIKTINEYIIYHDSC